MERRENAELEVPDHMVSLPGMSPGMLNRERELSACRNQICPTGEAPLRAELGPGPVGLSRDGACSWGWLGSKVHLCSPA